MADPESATLEKLVQSVRSSSKYRAICPEFVRGLGSVELAKRDSLKQAIKATKRKLHQVAGAFLDARPDYGRWLERLEGAHQKGEKPLRQACREFMERHASTRERLEILDRFYSSTLGVLPPIRSVLDLACGFNPLAIPWMPLAEGATYYAFDIYGDLADFLNAFFGLIGLPGQASACDVIRGCPQPRVDLALVLKTIPCLEQAGKTGFGLDLLDRIEADHVLVSFPVHSLGGKDKGMPATYEYRFRQMLAKRDWDVRRFEFPTELAFLVAKRP